MELTNFGALRSCYDARDFGIIASASENLPTKYNVPIYAEIKNQGARSTCVAHALSSLVEIHNASQYGEQRSFSTDFIYGLRDVFQTYGEGMNVRQALSNLRKYGDCYFEDCPTNSTVDEARAIVQERFEELCSLAYPHRISTYYRCENAQQIKTALIKHGPVIITVKMYSNARLVDDIYTWDANDSYGYHCMLCYGYDERGWLIQNSWGRTYGKDGRFVLPYDFELIEAWGVTDNIDDPIVIKKRTTPITNFFYKFYNKLINLFLKLKNKE